VQDWESHLRRIASDPQSQTGRCISKDRIDSFRAYGHSCCAELDGDDRGGDPRREDSSPAVPRLQCFEDAERQKICLQASSVIFPNSNPCSVSNTTCGDGELCVAPFPFGDLHSPPIVVLSYRPNHALRSRVSADSVGAHAASFNLDLKERTLPAESSVGNDIGSVIFLGHPFELLFNVDVSDYQIRDSWHRILGISTSRSVIRWNILDGVVLFLKYLISVSGSIALLNCAPVHGFDGSYVLRLLVAWQNEGLCENVLNGGTLLLAVNIASSLIYMCCAS